MKWKRIIISFLVTGVVGIIAYACTQTSRLCSLDGIDSSAEPIQIEYTNPGPTMYLKLKANQSTLGGVFVDVLDSNGTVVVQNIPCPYSLGRFVCQITANTINQLSTENPIQISGFASPNTVFPKKIILNLKNSNGKPLFNNNEEYSQVISYVPLCGIPNAKTQNSQPITDGIADCAALFPQSATQGGTTLDSNWELAGMVLQNKGLGIYQIWARTDVSSLNDKITEGSNNYVLMSDYIVPDLSSPSLLNNFCQANGITSQTTAQTAQVEFSPTPGTSQMLTAFLNDVIKNNSFGCNADTYFVSSGVQGYALTSLNMCESYINKEARGYPLFQNVAWSLAKYDNIIGHWYSWASTFIPVGKQGVIWSESISSQNENYTYAFDGIQPYLWEMDVNIGAAIRCVAASQLSKNNNCN